MARTGDGFVDLVARQLAAFARLGALRHLDLQILGAGQIVDGHAKTAGSHLPDGAGAAFAVGVRRVAFGIFAAFAGVAHAADAVHGDGDGLMGLRAQRAETHGAADEMLQDAFDGFHFVQRDGLFRFAELQQVAQADRNGGFVDAFRKRLILR